MTSVEEHKTNHTQGAHFLLYLERLLGGTKVFIPYMKSYVNTFSGTSISTDQWRTHLFDYFGGLPDGSEYVRKLGKVDWDEVGCLVWASLTD